METITLPAGSGADTFVFRSDQGTDIITDFQTGLDKVELTKNFAVGVDTFEELAPYLSNYSGHAVLALPGTYVVYQGLQTDQLHANDFYFV